MFAGSPSSAPSSRRGLTNDRLTIAFGVLLFSGFNAHVEVDRYKFADHGDPMRG